MYFFKKWSIYLYFSSKETFCFIDKRYTLLVLEEKSSTVNLKKNLIGLVLQKNFIVNSPDNASFWEAIATVRQQICNYCHFRKRLCSLKISWLETCQQHLQCPRSPRQRAFDSPLPAPIITGAEILDSPSEPFLSHHPLQANTVLRFESSFNVQLMLKLCRFGQTLGSSAHFERKFKKRHKRACLPSFCKLSQIANTNIIFKEIVSY